MKKKKSKEKRGKGETDSCVITTSSSSNPSESLYIFSSFSSRGNTTEIRDGLVSRRRTETNDELIGREGMVNK